MNYTIKEIAELTGVAKSTVSKALNGQKGVSEEKRQEILKLVSKCNYVPNAAARALSHNKSETIGILISSDAEYMINSSYWMEIIVSVAEEAERNNYNILLIRQDEKEPLKSLQNAVFKRAIDGIVIPAEQATMEIIKLLNKAEIPFVFQGKSNLCSNYCVDIKNEEGARILTEKLLESGCKKIGCIAGPEVFSYNQERAEGFRAALKNYGIDEYPIVFTDYKREETLANIKNFIKANPGLDSFIIMAGGDFLFHIFDAMKECGLKDGKTSLAIFDDCPQIHYLPYRIFSARQPVKQMGFQDAKILFQLIKGENPPKLSLFDINLVK
ncbi:MAG: LacI family DNA-binding transcriptional regulator [Treponema sp.]|nr:LacI family transcriptional regulator [Spirochaetia bacterium]MDD7458346.1 LacI family DNA-binding transcriptional regulator [Spirochaetales bacterium]MDY5810681.1 LacI family DNA-binding transcriptional regulator [Treponema sp.]